MNKIKAALYARVSTDDKGQNVETQLLPLRHFCQDAGWEIYQEYTDEAKAKDYIHRISWEKLCKDARTRKFNVVLFWRLDRAFRSAKECLNCLESWEERGIRFKSLTQDFIDTTTSGGRLMLQIAAAFAEFESTQISERVRAGMARAKAQGRPIGRRSYNITSQTICDALLEYLDIGKAAKKLSCSRGYIYKILGQENIKPLDIIGSGRHREKDVTKPSPKKRQN